MTKNDKDKKVDKERDIGLLMNKMVIFGGPKVGFMTNPKTEKEPCFIEICGQKIVCLAQGGECRDNYDYYSPGLGDRKSWTTPIIDESCQDKCPYKMLVCDNHDEKCEGSVTYYPQYNKFNGTFKRYCKNFGKYIKNADKENGKIRTRRQKEKTITKKGKDGQEITDVYYGYYKYEK